MSAKHHTFVDIFESEFKTGETSAKISKIEIPIIQRDYAQGRNTEEIKRIRNRLLDSLRRAVEGIPISLDFVYGDVDENGIMTPLDGQQRLTTLFLLHWYAAKKDNIPEDECKCLNNFSYETRYSAREFCKSLLKFTPAFGKSDNPGIRKQIIDQPWFPLNWLKDPTIDSMLNMIDAIASKFADAEHLWKNLKDGKISFYFLPIKDMGLTDDLYIKMNSRGKPLTKFEQLKAELEKCIREYDNETAGRVLKKIDRDWTDLLWLYRNSGTGTDNDNITDDEFLRYFRFICDVLCFKKGEMPEKDSDEIELLDIHFSAKNKDARDNVREMESLFDCWLNIPNAENPLSFFSSFLSGTHERGKIMAYRNDNDDKSSNIDIFNDCLRTYGSNKFGRNKFVLLYAVCFYLRNYFEIQRSDFLRRIRIINNLLQNSDDELSENKGRIPAILKQTEFILRNGAIDSAIGANYNAFQSEEEKTKIEFLADFPNRSETLFRLEDHPLLKGQIRILGIENISMTDKFIDLFKCDKDKVACALMAVGDYGQNSNNGHYQYGAESDGTWIKLFHKSSSNKGFEEKTQKTLIDLLSWIDSVSGQSLDIIANDYLSECENKNEYPMRYYYIKYSVFRVKTGKLYNKDAQNEPYMFFAVPTKERRSENMYIPFLKAADGGNNHLDGEDKKDRLNIPGNKYIMCANDSFVVKNSIDGSLAETIRIPQNEDGTDTADRVQILNDYLMKISA